MASSNFIDYVKINCRSGAGGAGSLHFRREKHTPKGGPDGGDGGRGGHIVLRGNAQHWTLLHLKYRKHVKAGNGVAGEGGRRSGAHGEDVVLEVPLGTIARHPDTGEKLAEITEHDQEVILLAGGRGGLGNDHFKTSTQQAPHYAQPGEPGLEEWIILELKLLADVGLVGFPNAGKSTLLSVMSAARPEIAEYAFTTLVPNLGVVAYRDYKSFVMADIPGIIEGASQGKGIGLRFLRHIERNSVLLFLIAATSENIRQEYNTLLNELHAFNPELMDKGRLLAITKIDLVDDDTLARLKDHLPQKVPTVFVSSVSQRGLNELKDSIWQQLNATEPV
ncbi:GTPase ObgE [Spirosoma daeguense]